MFDLDKAKHLYFNERMTLKKVGEMLGYSCSGIRYIFAKNGIKSRNNSECRIGKPRPDMFNAKNWKWKGGKYTNSAGYVLVLKPDHHRADSKGYVREHILIAERVLGRILKPNEVVHHINEIPNDNRNSNLIICENENYHRTLHRRKRAYEMCGNSNWFKCLICKKYDDKNNLRIFFHKNGQTIRPYHKKCITKYNQKKWKQVILNRYLDARQGMEGNYDG